MALTLYAATVPSYRQILGAVSGLIDKAEAFCAEKRLAPEEIIQARLAPDMLPFAYQVKSTAVHSLGALKALRAGTFSPDMTPPPASFPALKACVAEALSGVEAITPAELESFVGRDMRFELRDMSFPFTAEEFLLSFSQPNFYFHATTAYDILRWKGLPIGKRDFAGALRIKR